jgi:hypothetical protein
MRGGRFVCAGKVSLSKVIKYLLYLCAETKSQIIKHRTRYRQRAAAAQPFSLLYPSLSPRERMPRTTCVPPPPPQYPGLHTRRPRALRGGTRTRPLPSGRRHSEYRTLAVPQCVPSVHLRSHPLQRVPRVVRWWSIPRCRAGEPSVTPTWWRCSRPCSGRACRTEGTPRRAWLGLGLGVRG